MRTNSSLGAGAGFGKRRAHLEAERQARGETVTTREETNLDDLGLEVGAALAEAGPGAEA